jgi:hypothetical protein
MPVLRLAAVAALRDRVRARRALIRALHRLPQRALRVGRGVALGRERCELLIQGSDYFSTARGMGGGAVSGPFRLTAHLSDHQPGPPESWREIVTGILWNVHAPGAGSIFNDTLGIHRSVEVSPAGLIYSVIRQAVGHHAFDVAELCESLGYTLLP